MIYGQMLYYKNYISDQYNTFMCMNWKLARSFILFIQTLCCVLPFLILSAKQQKMLFVLHRIFSQEFNCISFNMNVVGVSHRLTHTIMLVYPMYPFAVYSLRGTWSVGFTGWFSLWVMFYVFDEWFMGKLRGSLEFLHTIIKH